MISTARKQRQACIPLEAVRGYLFGYRPSTLSRQPSALSGTPSTDRASTAWQSIDDDKSLAGIECLDYSPSLHLLAVALTDGSCAILRAGSPSSA